MAEQKITITIDENGQIQAKTYGFQGTACLEELDKLLDSITLSSLKTTDDYHQQQQQNTINQQKIEKK
jgi:hypothetical protein